jgi:phage regulator Rha-like protein
MGINSVFKHWAEKRKRDLLRKIKELDIRKNGNTKERGR